MIITLKKNKTKESVGKGGYFRWHNEGIPFTQKSMSVMPLGNSLFKKTSLYQVTFEPEK